MRSGDVVSLRVRTPAGPAEVVGTLVAATASTLSVRRRDGRVVEVPVDDVQAGRVVPPGPSRTISPDALEAVMTDGWRADEVARLGPWLLRAGRGFTGRANSALVTADPLPDLPDTLAAIEGWYADRGLPAQLQAVVGGEPPGLVDLLTATAWTAAPRTHVLTAEAAHVLAAVGPRAEAADVQLDARPDNGWLGMYRRDGGPLPPAAVDILTRHPSVMFASVRSAGRCVAVGRAAVGGRWAGLFAVEVDAAQRRNGLGSAVVAALMRWSVGQGARRGYLQVRSDNETGVAFWQRLGFSHHHDYAYWTAPRRS